jgi:hypothetical protein
MNDKTGKPFGVSVYHKATGEREVRAPAKRQELLQVQATALEKPEAFASAIAAKASEVSQENPQTVKPGKGKSKPEIEGLADFIDAFYTGKTKALGGTTLRKLIKNVRIEELKRYELLALAEENDPTLEKSLNLMLLADDLGGYRGIEDQLRFFAAEVGRRVPGRGKTSLHSWLPKAADEGLELQAMAVEAMEAYQSVAASECAVADMKKALKRLECGFYLACQWRLYQGTAPRVLIDVLRRHVFERKAFHQEHSDGLIRLLHSLPFAESPGMTWLLDDQVRQLQQANAKADHLQHELTQLEKTKRQLEHDLKACEDQLADQGNKFSRLQEQFDAATEQVRLQNVYSNDDLSRLRGQVLKLLSSELPLLQDALTALERDPPILDAARDYLGGVVENLRKEITRIKG